VFISYTFEVVNFRGVFIWLILCLVKILSDQIVEDL